MKTVWGAIAAILILAVATGLLYLTNIGFIEYRVVHLACGLEVPGTCSPKRRA